MKTPKIFAIAAVVLLALYGQVGNYLKNGEALHIEDYPAYYSAQVNSTGIPAAAEQWFDREWRKLRLRVTYKINGFVDTANAVRAEAFGTEEVTAVASSNAPKTSLRPKARPANLGQASNAPKTSLRPKARPEGLAQRFAIAKAIREATEQN